MNRFTVRLAAYAVAAAMMAMFASCGSEDEPKKEEDKPNPPETEEPAKPNERVDIDLTPAEAQLAKKTAMLSYKVFRAAHEVERKEYKPQPNMVISPLCGIMAMEMIANGASDDTYAQIMEGLGLSTENIAEINGLNKKLLEQLPKLDNTVGFRLGNAAWMLEDVYDGMTPGFAACLEEYYGCMVRNMDSFVGLEPQWMINDWGRELTRGLIYAMFDRPFHREMPFLLASATYIKGKSKYSISHPEIEGQFTNEDGSMSAAILYMASGDDICWYSDNYLDAVRLPYGNEAFSTVMILPRDGITLDECIAEMNPDKIYDLSCGGGQPINSAILMREFTISHSSDMRPVFQKMGITKAFAPKTALFTGINPKGKIYLGDMIQKTKVDVSSQTEAASEVTLAGLSKSSDPESGYLNVDRPFAFIIAERSTGLPLFMGRVTKL